MKKRLYCVLCLISVNSAVFCGELPKILKEGWYLACDGRYDTFMGDTEFVQPGASANLSLGYTSNAKIGFEGVALFDSVHSFKSGYTYGLSDGYNSKYFEKFHFGGLAFNLKYYFPKIFVFPYIKAGVGAYAFGDQSNSSIAGVGYQFGTGAEQYVTRTVLLRYGLTYRTIKFDKTMLEGKSGTLNNTLNSSSISFEIGLSRYWD